MVIETDSDNVDSLRQMEGVVNVWAARTMQRPRVEKSTYGPSKLRKNYTVHYSTGVDKLHAAGIRGKGATVAIIDTGIDYTHKAVWLFSPSSPVFHVLTSPSLEVVLALDARSEEAMTWSELIVSLEVDRVFVNRH